MGFFQGGVFLRRRMRIKKLLSVLESMEETGSQKTDIFGKAHLNAKKGNFLLGILVKYGYVEQRDESYFITGKGKELKRNLKALNELFEPLY